MAELSVKQMKTGPKVASKQTGEDRERLTSREVQCGPMRCGAISSRSSNAQRVLRKFAKFDLQQPAGWTAIIREWLGLSLLLSRQARTHCSFH